MNVHLVLPDLFWPHREAASPYADLDLAALETLFGRGRRSPHRAAALEPWLAARYGIGNADRLSRGGAVDPPYAAYALRGDGGEPGDAAWLRCDPCHLRLGTDQLVLVDAASFGLDAAEAAALTATLGAHFAADGLAFYAPAPGRWYLRLPQAPAMTTTPLAAVRAQSIDPLLPRGADARAWHARLNEVQMLLHDHPVNAAREARGEPAVNSVWLWGGGRADGPPLRRPFARVRADDPLALGLARASGAAAAALPADGAAWLDQTSADGIETGIEAIVLDQLRAPAAYGEADAWRTQLATIERRWIAPLLAALRSGRLGMLTLHAVGRGGALQAETTRQDLRYFWRRPRPLPAWQPTAAEALACG
jgi:hypothetical protein